MYLNHGVCGEVINTPDCDSGIRGFNSPQTPHFMLNSFFLKLFFCVFGRKFGDNIFCGWQIEKNWWTF